MGLIDILELALFRLIAVWDHRCRGLVDEAIDVHWANDA